MLTGEPLVKGRGKNHSWAEVKLSCGIYLMTASADLTENFGTRVVTH